MENKILFKTAWLTSVTAHPMLVPIYSLIYLFYFSATPWHFNYSSAWKIYATLFTSLGTTLLPLIWLGICLALRIVKEMEMRDKAERFWPLLLSCITCGITGILAPMFFRVPEPVMAIIWGEFLLLLTALIITPHYKISLHMMGIGAFFMFVMRTNIIFGLDFCTAASVIIIIGSIIAWARLYLNAHTRNELLLGILVGLNCMYYAFCLA